MTATKIDTDTIQQHVADLPADAARYEIVHRDQFFAHSRPADAFAIRLRGHGVALNAEQLATVPDVYRALVDTLNQVDDAALNDAERGRVALIANPTPPGGLDAGAGESFKARSVDAYWTGSGAPISRRALASIAPALHGVIDQANGTTDEPLALTIAEKEAKARADAIAAEEAEKVRQAEADRAAVEEAVGDVCDALKKTTWPLQRRAAAILNGAALFALRPDLIPLLEHYDNLAD